jgi:hypothetical protein
MHDEWDEVCGLFFKGRDDHGCNEGMFELKDGRRFASFNTKYGDGAYFDQYGEKYSVDAGLIGCIALNDIDLNADGNFTSGGQIIEFKSDFSVSGSRGLRRRDWDGEIRIGHIVVKTEEEEYYD